MFEDLPIGPQWVLNHDDIQAIAADYGLPINVAAAQTLSGAVNGVVRIPRERGEVIFRVHRPWTTPARLTAIHELLRTLRLADLPIPRILLTRTGATWARLADRLVEVAEYVSSDYSADTWERNIPTFATLARLHAALARIPSIEIPAPPYSSYAAPRTALDMLAETESRFHALADLPGYQQAAAARQATRMLLDALLIERRRYESALPRGLIHGDYGGDNVLLRGDQVVAILDFDFLAERERIFDLAYALYWTLDRFCLPRGGMLPPEICLAHAAGLVRQYQRHTATPLTEGELAALPFEMARIPLYQIVEAGYLSEADHPAGAVGQTLRFARHVPVAAAYAADAARIGRLFGDALR